MGVGQIRIQSRVYIKVLKAVNAAVYAADGKIYTYKNTSQSHKLPQVVRTV